MTTIPSVQTIEILGRPEKTSVKVQRILIKPSVTTSPLALEVAYPRQFCCVQYHFCSLSRFRETKPCLFDFTLVCTSGFHVNGVYAKSLSREVNNTLELFLKEIYLPHLGNKLNDLMLPGRSGLAAIGLGVVLVLENPMFKQTRPKLELPTPFAISHPLNLWIDLRRAFKSLFMGDTPPPLLGMILIVECFSE